MVFSCSFQFLFGPVVPKGMSSRWVSDTKSLASDQRELEKTLAVLQNVNRKVEQAPLWCV